MKLIDMSWVFLRILSRRSIDPIPISEESNEQIVPFWTGLYKRLSESKYELTFVMLRSLTPNLATWQQYKQP